MEEERTRSAYVSCRKRTCNACLYYILCNNPIL